MNKPLVSVILTAYNDAEYLPTALEALKSQTLENIEVICVDNNSSDDGPKLMEEFCKKDKRFRLIKNTENLGPSGARNVGIDEAKSPYVMFCDADDYYDEAMCEKMYNAINDSGADLAVCEVNVIYHAHQEMRRSDDNYYGLKFSGLQMVSNEIVNNTDMAPTNKIFRKGLLNKYDLRFPAGLRFEDAYFCSAYFFIAEKIMFVNERLYNYIRRANSIMSQTWSKDKTVDFAIDHYYVATKLFDFLEKNDLQDKYEGAFWQLFVADLAFAINNSKSSARRKQIRKEAKEFIDAHQEFFSSADVATREQIQKLYQSRFHINTVGVKRLLLRFMPTYSLEIENIQRMRTLRKKSQKIIDDVDARVSKG